MNKIHNPAEIPPPIGAYSHGIEVPPGARTLHISGQVGIAPDGKVAPGIEGQTEAALNNIVGILKAAGMGVQDIVKMTTFLIDANDIAKVRAVRVRILGDHRPASTLLVISRLAAPEYLIEIEATAAKA
jgi:enamine deaminase RidA (YjgF/YER057c/UK114 family)